jgi:predicted anti-sigma-YlaC factor YlaD
MKCNDCLNLLEVHLDGEAGERNSEQVREHLMACASCTSAFEALTAESELFARYDRELEISPAIWSGIAARIATDGNGAAKSNFSLSGWFAGLFAMPSFRFAMPVAALALIAIVIGVAYWRTRPERQRLSRLRETM